MRCDNSSFAGIDDSNLFVTLQSVYTLSSPLRVVARRSSGSAAPSRASLSCAAPLTHKHQEKGALSNFPLSPSTLTALKQKGIKALFPIQYVTFKHVAGGKDVLARARTGTGKTLAFALPIIEQVGARQRWR